MSNILTMKAIRPCTGCGICSAVCPTKAISIMLSDDGFYIPHIKESECLNCGVCIKTCYKFDSEYNVHLDVNDNVVCYGAKNRSKEELKKASSGAVSIELMRACIALGYKVVGVVYDVQAECAITKIANTVSELDQFRGSKYFQSYTEESFREIISDASYQKYAVFGTPCQIYAFSKYADSLKIREKFLLIDFFCHGCPSLNLWKKYLVMQKNKYGVSEFGDIHFRSKTHGWHEYCFDFVESTKSKQYSSSKYQDYFFDIFFSIDVMNKACYDCVARSSVEKADIRMGDFWGARYDKDIDGVSAVVLNTERGRELFNKVKNAFDVESVLFEEVILAQSYGKKHILNEGNRNYMLNLLKSDSPLQEIAAKHSKLQTPKQRLEKVVKRSLKYLPSGMYLSFKTMVHRFGSR